MCLCNIFDRANVTGHWSQEFNSHVFNSVPSSSGVHCSYRVVIDSRTERDRVLLRCDTMRFKSFLQGTKCGIAGR